MIIISSRDSVEVVDGPWKMLYHPSGSYSIYKNNKEYTYGKYDAVIADSYNTGMPKEERLENLRRDLASWIGKTVKGKV